MVTHNTEQSNSGPIQRTIAYCAQNPFLTILTVAAMTAWGYYSLRQIPLDAIPDLSDAQVMACHAKPACKSKFRAIE